MSEEISAPQTVQTGQKAPGKGAPFFEIAMDEEGHWHWMLWSANGRMMAKNAVAFDRKKDVIPSIRSMQKVIPTVKLIVQSHQK